VKNFFSKKMGLGRIIMANFLKAGWGGRGAQEPGDGEHQRENNKEGKMKRKKRGGANVS